MGEVLLIIIGIIILFIILAVFLSDNKTLENTSRNKEMIQKIKNDTNDLFEPTKSYISKNQKSGVEIDEKQKLVRLYYTNDSNNIEYKIYSFKDIIESEIKIDNNSVLKTGRGSQLAGVAIGGVLAGGIGAIIGGLSGTKKKIEYIKNIDLCIKVSDFEKPLYKINFLSNINEVGIENKQGYKKDDKEVKKALEDIEYWHTVLNLILKEN